MNKMLRILLSIIVLGLFFNPVAYSVSNENIKKDNKQQEVDKYYYSKTAIKHPSRDNGDTVIYDQDDRKDLYELTANQALQKRLAKSVCLLTNKSDVKLNQNAYQLTLSAHTETDNDLQSCAGEKFSEQEVGGWCTGFLVAPDVVATAGHCVKNANDVKNTAFVFGFVMTDKDNVQKTFKKNQVYYGKKLIAHKLINATDEDYSLVQLTQSVTLPGAVPLEVRSSGSAKVNDQVGVIGHPSGLPLKISYGSSTKILEITPNLYRTNLDTFGGNSGSPVFNKNGIVEGILIQGAGDYVPDESSTCFKPARLENEVGEEMVTKASLFVNFIPPTP